MTLLLWMACLAERAPEPSEVEVLPFTCDPELPAVEPDATCELVPTTGTFVPITEWRVTDFTPTPESREVMMTPVVGHLTDDDGDGVYGSIGDVPDIAFITYIYSSWYSGVLRVLSGDDGHAHYSVSTVEIQGQGGLALGDLEGDGAPEIVAVTTSGEIVAFDHAGTEKWRSEKFGGFNHSVWPMPVNTVCTNPAISDMDGDGIAEVVAGSVIVSGLDGSTLGVGTLGQGTGGGTGNSSFTADLDLDGVQELVTGNAAYRIDGSVLYSNGASDGHVAVGDFDSDPEAEVVVSHSGTVSLLEHDYTPIWDAKLPGDGSGPPTVGDFDGDGAPEVGVAGFAFYAVVDTDGSLLWSKTTQDATSGVTGSAMYDFDGDGSAEVVYSDETRLWVFDGKTGDVLLATEHESATWLEYPTIADVDGDGAAEIVVVNNRYTNGRFSGVAVVGDDLDSWGNPGQVWNQHAFHVTNVEADLGIPAIPDPPWTGQNTFRGADPARRTAPAADLVAEVLGVCADSCGEKGFDVLLRLVNLGAASVTAEITVLVKVDDEAVWSFVYDEPLGPGEASTPVTATLGRDALAAGATVVVDPEDHVRECDEDNSVEFEFACP